VAHEDLGEGDGNDVITIGDSWMNFLVTGIEQSLERVSGRNYRNFALLGTLVLNEQIPNQYYSARMQDADIKTVVLTGGGNDILNSPCTGDACEPLVDQVSERLNMLMQTEMGMDGVEDVILIGYTYPADMGKHASLDYSIMLSGQSCTKNTMPRCHFIDSTQLDITLQDGIHPDPAGYDLIGTTVWQLMQAEGIRR
jgi:lysophospholipase L1-like esterase